MSESNINKNIKEASTDELLDAYQAAAKDDSFVPSPRVRGAVLMYARTLADHRNAFPGSVAHRNEDEELELSSVPRAPSTLDPRPLPVKPLEEEHESWPRDLPPAPVASAWASLGRWVATAAAGGLALGASYSWFSANLHKTASPEPMIAQAPAAPAAAIPVPAPVPQTAAQTEMNKPAVLAEAKSAAPAANAANTSRIKPDKEVVNKTKPSVVRERKEPLTGSLNKEPPAGSLSKEPPVGSVNNPPVMVADGRAITQPQIASRSLSSPSATPAAAEQVAVAAPPAAAPPAAAVPAPYTAPQAAATAAAPSMAGARAASVAKAEGDVADSANNTNAPTALNKALARPEHEADPQKWMAYIIDLRSRGRSREASIELVRLRDRYPKFNAGTAAGNAAPPAATTSSSPAQ
jgi:hypothetical protein